MPADVLELDEDNCAKIIPPLLTTHRVKVENFNTKRLNDVSQQQQEPLRLFAPKIKVKRDGFGDASEEMNLESKFPIYNVRLCKNAQVMMRCNALMESGICNGTLGIIDKITDKKIYVRFRVDGVLQPPINVPRYRFVLKINHGDIYMEQYPLSIAYAVTIHKSQGLTLDTAIVDIRKVFANSMVYVALSRVCSLDGLQLLGNFDTRTFKSNQEALDFEKDGQMTALVSGCTRNVKQPKECALHNVMETSYIADRNIFGIIKEFL